MNIEQIKADREAGTQGPWRMIYDAVETRIEPCGTKVFRINERHMRDAGRIARVPDLEKLAIDAIDLVGGLCPDNWKVRIETLDDSAVIPLYMTVRQKRSILAFLKKYTKPD